MSIRDAYSSGHLGPCRFAFTYVPIVIFVLFNLSLFS